MWVAMPEVLYWHSQLLVQDTGPLCPGCLLPALAEGCQASPPPPPWAGSFGVMGGTAAQMWKNPRQYWRPWPSIKDLISTLPCHRARPRNPILLLTAKASFNPTNPHGYYFQADRFFYIWSWELSLTKPSIVHWIQTGSHHTHHSIHSLCGFKKYLSFAVTLKPLLCLRFLLRIFDHLRAK